MLPSFQKPFQPVSKDMISRRIKSVLKDSGVDITKFRAPSSRAASTRDEACAGALIDCILAFNWCSNS